MNSNFYFINTHPLQANKFCNTLPHTQIFVIYVNRNKTQKTKLLRHLKTSSICLFVFLLLCSGESALKSKKFRFFFLQKKNYRNCYAKDTHAYHWPKRKNHMYEFESDRKNIHPSITIITLNLLLFFFCFLISSPSHITNIITATPTPHKHTHSINQSSAKYIDVLLSVQHQENWKKKIYLSQSITFHSFTQIAGKFADFDAIFVLFIFFFSLCE